MVLIGSLLSKVYILLKIYYFIAVLGDEIFSLIWPKFVSSFYCSFIRIIVHDICFRDLDNLCLTYELYVWAVQDCQLIS
jgi:hypothetical protein